MSNINKVRLAHELLDEVNAREDLTPEQVGVLRSFLPERPKQKTLEDVYREVCNAWYRTDGNVWKADAFGDLEDWLYGLYEQLKGLIDAQPIAPALPEGMRLADHEEYGRVVVSPKADDENDYKIFYFNDDDRCGAGYTYVYTDDLTFIDAEPVAPAKPSHPEFLETAADYENAPVGTIVVAGGNAPWIKRLDGWHSQATTPAHSSTMSCKKRAVLRWGWGE